MGTTPENSKKKEGRKSRHDVGEPEIKKKRSNMSAMSENLKQNEGIESEPDAENLKQNEGIKSRRDTGEPKTK